MPEYIDREAAIKGIMSDSPEQVSYCREDAADCIRYMDAADVAPVRHGRWEYYDTYMDGTTVFRCSYCGYKQNGRNIWSWKKNFCPNCGAIMDLK